MSQAILLSYAAQDTAVARRICNLLRPAGLARRLGKQLYRLPNTNRRVTMLGLMRPAQATILRNTPRFKALQAKRETDPRFSPHAVANNENSIGK